MSLLFCVRKVEDDQRPGAPGAPLLSIKVERVQLFSLEQRRLQGDLTATFQCLREAHKKAFHKVI